MLQITAPDHLDAQREIIRLSLDQIRNDIGMALRDARRRRIDELLIYAGAIVEAHRLLFTSIRSRATCRSQILSLGCCPLKHEGRVHCLANLASRAICATPGSSVAYRWSKSLNRWASALRVSISGKPITAGHGMQT
jgi:hypothetical protein